jgi:hypothetical protein
MNIHPLAIYLLFILNLGFIQVACKKVDFFIFGSKTNNENVANTNLYSKLFLI